MTAVNGDISAHGVMFPKKNFEDLGDTSAAGIAMGSPAIFDMKYDRVENERALEKNSIMHRNV